MEHYERRLGWESKPRSYRLNLKKLEKCKGAASLLLLSSFALVYFANSVSSVPKRNTFDSRDVIEPLGGHMKNDPVIGNEKFAQENARCRLYLAPSSIPHAGLGVFTTNSIKTGSNVFPEADGPSVVITDPAQNHKNVTKPEWASKIFMWSVRHSNQEAKESREIIPNIGSMCNYHPYLYNIKFSRFEEEYDDSFFNRYVDPGAGAFSYHMGKKWFALRDVEAGEEIFCDYGESFFLYWLRRWGVDTDGFPLRKDYDEASAVLKTMITEWTKSGQEVNETLLANTRSSLAMKNKRAASLLPKSPAEFAAMSSTHDTQTQLAMELARNSVIARPVEWIEQNGNCLDNIVAGRSTIPQSGRGAFARRTLLKGSIVIPVPLPLVITDKETLNIYRMKKDQQTGKLKPTGDLIGRQLLVNYCFGHERSSLLLCPGSSANLVNHCSNRTKIGGQCAENGPNAEIRWASSWDESTPVWLQKSLSDIRNEVANGRRGLSFEIVATRDIELGEEVFIDYGAEWEESWERHLTEWRPPKAENATMESYASLTQLNRNRTSIRTSSELRDDPYPSNVNILCHHDGKPLPCTVLERENADNSRFTVQVEPKHSSPKKLHNFPRENIIFSMKPYSSDQHLPGAFRKNIGIRDDMWPDQWKNLPENE